MLENIRSPRDLDSLTYPQLAELASEIRAEIISTVAENGGHLASNLGIVEATLAVHRVFNAPKDSVIFDVGHQAYAHKLITGRYRDFCTLRKSGGISGFTCRSESAYDTVTVGHCGTSISAALGIAEANKLAGNDNYTVAIVGDGSFTNGEIWEALNNCAGRGLKLIIILNDNEMSISHNVGAMSRALVKLSNSRRYFTAKHNIKRFFSRIPIVGNALIKITREIKDMFKHIFFSNNLFEALGLDYLGPIDGMNQSHLESVLEEAKLKDNCTLVHIITKKGAGYPLAEQMPDKYHSTAPFDSSIGVTPSGGDSFSANFGRIMTELAKTNDKLCAITAAMCDGTGLSDFAKLYPNRFFDVGIAEEHAVTFSAGLAIAGFRPVCVMYSTFSQRVYDQIWQDAALQGLPVIFALDRAGFVDGDGYSHQGLYDVALMRSIPNIIIYSPVTYREQRYAFDRALEASSPVIIRYPKGGEIKLCEMVDRGDFSYTEANCDTYIISYGRAFAVAASEADDELGKSGKLGLIKLLRIFPIDFDEIIAIIGGAKKLIFIEEGIKSGSLSEYILTGLAEHGYSPEALEIRAIDGEFVPHAKAEELLKKYLAVEKYEA